MDIIFPALILYEDAGFIPFFEKTYTENIPYLII